MRHMARAWGCRLRRAVIAVAVTLLGLLAFSVPALGADPPPLPKPDPPPKANPPPPPAVVTPPPAPQPVAPAPVAPAPPATPSVVHPTAAERRAVAKRKAARAAQARARARAQARAAAAKKLAAAHRSERAKDVLAAGSDGPSSDWGLPFLLGAFSLALLMLGLALVPAWVVPWSRASRALEARRDEFGVMGAMGLVATLAFFLLVEVTK
jgi:hypothetical protein